MARVKLAGMLLLCGAVVTVAFSAPADRSRNRLNRYIVRVAPRRDAGEVGQDIAQRIGGQLGHVYRQAVTGFSIHVPAGLAAQDIQRLPGVAVVEPDVVVHAVAQTLPTGVDRIEADNSGVTGPIDVDIALLDTGIDRDHPDLRVAGGRRFRSILWWSRQDDQYDDDNGHGTHCAGIAAAKDNDIGVVGVAPGARVWAVKVLDRNGEGYLSDVIAGVDWVTARAGTIEVANLSLSATAASSIFRTAIQQSVGAGVVYVVAAGNDGSDVYGDP